MTNGKKSIYNKSSLHTLVLINRKDMHSVYDLAGRYNIDLPHLNYNFYYKKDEYYFVLTTPDTYNYSIIDNELETK